MIDKLPTSPARSPFLRLPAALGARQGRWRELPCHVPSASPCRRRGAAGRSWQLYFDRCPKVVFVTVLPGKREETAHANHDGRACVPTAFVSSAQGGVGAGRGRDGVGAGRGPGSGAERRRRLAHLQPRPRRHPLLAPRPDRRVERRRARGGLVVPVPPRGRVHRGAEPGRALPAGDADRGRRRDVPRVGEPGGGPAPRDRRGDLASRAGRGAGVVPRRRLRAGHRRPRGPHLLHEPVEGRGPERGERRAGPRVRRRGRGGGAHPVHRGAGGLRRHPDTGLERLRPRAAAHRAPPEPAPGRGRAGPGLAAGPRRVRHAALGVPDPAHRERLRQRDLGQPELPRPHREQRVGVHPHRRRGARPRLHAREQPGVELLRRRPPRRQPLRELDHRHRHRDRRARLVLPEHPPRAVGLQPAAVAGPDGHRAGRRGHPRPRAGRQVGLDVHPEPRDRRARPRGRGAAGARG